MLVLVYHVTWCTLSVGIKGPSSRCSSGRMHCLAKTWRKKGYRFKADAPSDVRRGVGSMHVSPVLPTQQRVQWYPSPMTGHGASAPF